MTTTPQDELAAAVEREAELRYKRRLVADDIERQKRSLTLLEAQIKAAHADVCAAESAIRNSR